MTTVLIADDPDSRLIRSHRCSAMLRLRVRLGAFDLDRELACGAYPDSRPALSLRAQALIGRRRRHILAQRIRRVVELAERPPTPYDSRVPLSRFEIWLSRERLEALAAVIDGPEPVEPRGIARAEMLLRDGTSPFYYPPVRHKLAAALEQAMDALTARPGILSDV